MQTSDHRFTSIADARAFALAGNAIITLQSTRTGSHFTYKIQAPNAEKQAAKGFEPRPVWFVKLLVDGNADEGSWSYLGMIKNGEFFATKASAHMALSPSFKAFKFFFMSTELHPELVVRHENHCGRCGRTLTHPESIDLGIGPECAKMMEGGLN
jgi:hypothetical protein